MKQARKRDILLILSNRWNRNQKLRYVQLLADEQGNILKQTPLRGVPREPGFDEVWENDEGRSEWAACNKFRRKYPHPLEKKRRLGARAHLSGKT